LHLHILVLREVYGQNSLPPLNLIDVFSLCCRVEG
jgi:hypothetical protein